VHSHACNHVPPSSSGTRHSGRRTGCSGLRKLCVHHDQRHRSGDNTVRGGGHELVLVVRRDRRNRYAVDRRCPRVSVECRKSVAMGVDYIGGARTRRWHPDLYGRRERGSSGEAGCPRRERSTNRCDAGRGTVPLRSRADIGYCRAPGWGAHHPGPNPSSVRVEHSKRCVLGKAHPRRGTRGRLNPGYRRAEQRVRTSNHRNGCW
jgi:hypothetical protein